MTFFSKPLARMIGHADYYRMGGVLVVAVLLVLLFVLTQPINLRRHNALLNHFSQLQSDESRLGEAVLQLNFNLSNNYDQVNALTAQMRATVRELGEGDAGIDLHQSADFQQELQRLTQRLDSKQDALEQFKSRNAVLKNSLLYLPLARDELAQELKPRSPERILVNALMENLLLNRVKGGLLERGDVTSMALTLQAETRHLPPATRAKVASLVRHVQLIDQFERAMPELVRKLTSPPENSALAQSYASHFDHQQRRAAVYRLLLLLATLALLGYAARTFIRLREQTSHLQLAASVFASASEGITITDTQGIILNVNAAFSRLTGYSREEVIGKNPRLLNSGRQSPTFYQHMWQSIAATGTWQGEIWNRRKNGEVFPEWLTITAATTQQQAKQRVTHYVATFSDLSQRKKDAAEIFQLAFYDPLTALPNRRLLMERLQRALASLDQGADTVGQAALLFIDIDNFKSLNDIKGNDTGDLLLIEVAKRLLECTHENDTVARLGRDEFVVLLQGLDNKIGLEQWLAQVRAVAENIRKTLGTAFWLKNFEHTCTCSIGISLSGPGSHAEEMLENANTAMSQSKAAGRDALRFFDPSMQSALAARAALEADMRQAIVLQQFELYYQLQVNAQGDALGAEALLRWHHPSRGMVSPATFIPLSEETGLILPLGQWILEAACAQLKAWESLPAMRDLVLAVNISARQLSADGFVEQVATVLRTSGIQPARLKLEITESMLLSGVEKVIDTMQRIKAMGVSFSLDDFGTGYSSLQYLRRLPLDQVKIDQSFVRDIALHTRDQAIVGTIMAMANSLDLSVIAEGVETLEQRDLLASRGCHHYQGYLYSQPMPAAAFAALLQQRPLPNPPLPA